MTICAVFGCKSSNDKRRNKKPDKNVVEVSFCRFPRDEKLRKMWLYLCGRHEECEAKRLFVCLKHFELEDYVRNLRHELLNYYPKSSRKIKFDAIPRLFLPPHVVVPPRIKKPVIKNNDHALNSVNSAASTTIPKIYKTKNNQIIDEEPEIIIPPQIDLQATQFEFIDHVVMVYLNRCRSRAGNANVGMPQYILKGKAEEAAVLLGARQEDRYHWIEKFKKKIAENDAKGIVLTAVPESLSIADIIHEEWPSFARKKGLDIGEDSEETLSAVDEEERQDVTLDDNDKVIVNDKDKIQNKEPAPDCSRSISPVMEETCEDVQSQTSQKQSYANEKPPESASENEFLKHVLMVFIRRFNATWPQAVLPDIILHGKFREAAMLLGSKIKNRNVWLCAFKLSLQKKHVGETIITEPNLSLDINDIIEEEWPKFNFENVIATTEGSDLEEAIVSDETITVNNSEQNDVESSDYTIQTYEEARDCLNLLNKYALELGDYSALSLIKKVDSFLKSNDCEE